MLSIDPSIVVALIALLGTIINTLLTLRKQDKTEAVGLEHRITVLEERVIITMEERRCIIENALKIKFLFDYFVGDAAKGLKNPPVVDAALSKLENGGFSGYLGLTAKEKDEVETYARKILEDGRFSEVRKQKARLILGLRELENEMQKKNLIECEA